MEAEELTAEQLAAVYIKMRSHIEAKEDQHKQVMEGLKGELDLVATKLLEICNAQNADSIKTPAGTISRRVSSRYWTNDWGSMYEFIKEHDAPDLLEKRIHNANMQEFLDTHPDLTPVGLQADRKFSVSVRKPTKK